MMADDAITTTDINVSIDEFVKTARDEISHYCKAMNTSIHASLQLEEEEGAIRMPSSSSSNNNSWRKTPSSTSPEKIISELDKIEAENITLLHEICKLEKKLAKGLEEEEAKRKQQGSNNNNNLPPPHFSPKNKKKIDEEKERKVLRKKNKKTRKEDKEESDEEDTTTSTSTTSTSSDDEDLGSSSSSNEEDEGALVELLEQILTHGEVDEALNKVRREEEEKERRTTQQNKGGGGTQLYSSPLIDSINGEKEFLHQHCQTEKLPLYMPTCGISSEVRNCAEICTMLRPLIRNWLLQPSEKLLKSKERIPTTVSQPPQLPFSERKKEFLFPFVSDALLLTSEVLVGIDLYVTEADIIITSSNDPSSILFHTSFFPNELTEITGISLGQTSEVFLRHAGDPGKYLGCGRVPVNFQDTFAQLFNSSSSSSSASKKLMDISSHWYRSLTISAECCMCRYDKVYPKASGTGINLVVSGNPPDNSRVMNNKLEVNIVLPSDQAFQNLAALLYLRFEFNPASGADMFSHLNFPINAHWIHPWSGHLPLSVQEQKTQASMNLSLLVRSAPPSIRFGAPINFPEGNFLLSDLTPDEVKLLSQNHIHPIVYITAKQSLLLDPSKHWLTLMDFLAMNSFPFVNAPVLQAVRLKNFFVDKKWIVPRYLIEVLPK